jgi:hypothetical protein
VRPATSFSDRRRHRLLRRGSDGSCFQSVVPGIGESATEHEAHEDACDQQCRSHPSDVLADE